MMDRVFQARDGVSVYGTISCSPEPQEEHQQDLRALLQRLQQLGLVLKIKN
jgi:hypothetical protein